jgi:CrcB protein
VSALAVAAAIVTGGIASVVRYLVTLAFAQHRGLPWAVLVVNVVGSGIGGAVLGLSASGAIGTDTRLIILGGLAGGLTTFSTFSTETMQLARAGHVLAAVLNVIANLLFGILAATGGYLLTA